MFDCLWHTSYTPYIMNNTTHHLDGAAPQARPDDALRLAVSSRLGRASFLWTCVCSIVMVPTSIRHALLPSFTTSMLDALCAAFTFCTQQAEAGRFWVDATAMGKVEQGLAERVRTAEEGALRVAACAAQEGARKLVDATKHTKQAIRRALVPFRDDFLAEQDPLLAALTWDELTGFGLVQGGAVAFLLAELAAGRLAGGDQGPPYPPPLLWGAAACPLQGG